MLTIPAKWQRQGRRGKTPRLIVLHCTVSPEMGDGAEAVARYFASVTRAASTHTVHDNNSSVRCVADENTAFGAGGANDDGLHAELVGMPDQTRAQWLDMYSRAVLYQAGPTIRGWSAKYQIPLRWLTVTQVRDHVTKGLTTHADVEKAFPSTGHWDPGPNFPKDEALRIWTPGIESEDDMQPQRLYNLTDGKTTHTYLVQDGGIEGHHLPSDAVVKTWLQWGAVDKRSDGAYAAEMFHLLDGPLKTP